jgi:hypothetical protein
MNSLIRGYRGGPIKGVSLEVIIRPALPIKGLGWMRAETCNDIQKQGRREAVGVAITPPRKGSYL